MKQNFKTILIGTVFFALCIFAALYNNQNQTQNQTPDEKLERYTASFFDVFDTKTDIIAYSTDKELFTEQSAALKEKLKHYHRLFDIYNDYEGINNIKTINDHAGVAPVVVDSEIIALLKLSKEMYKQTNGQMNVAMGSVLKIWHNYREEASNNPAEAKVPPMDILEEANKYTDIDKIIIDEGASTVYLADEKMSIDVGSIGKGYAVERMAEYAKELGMTSVLLSVGGNICAVGTKFDGSAWRVGIQNPDTSSKDPHVEMVNIADVSVVTSGDYQRYYVVDGERYCHIIDGDTLMPADYFTSVSVILKDSGVADALSTSVFNMPFEEGLAFVNGLEGVEAIWVMYDGSLKYSDGFDKYIAK